MKRKFICWLGGLILTTALVTAGCSSANTETTRGDRQAMEQEKPVFKFAMSGQYKPFNYFNENNELTGFDVEIGKAISEKLGMEPEPIATPWQGIIAGLKNGRYDAIIGSMTITEDREKEVDFSEPYYVSGAQLFVAPGSNIKSIENVNDSVTVGVTISTVYEEKAREYTKKIKTYDSDVTALRDLAAGRTDAVITDRFVGLIAAKESGINVQPAGDLLFVERIGIAVRQGNDELREKINHALNEIKDEGTYLKISQSYFDRDISE